MTDTSEELELQHKALTISRIYFQSNLQSPVASEYLATRGLDSGAVRKFELGYAPEVWRGLVDHFSSHRVRLAAREAGLLSTMGTTNRLIDFFRGRLMFPIRTHTGDLAGYGGRIITDAQKESPKYINTRETALFDKSTILYGLHQNLHRIKNQREAIIVEGYMDVIRLSMSGYDYSVAPMGTALTPQQIDLLTDTGVRKLWFCLDGDAAGQKASVRNIETLMAHYRPELEVMVMHLPEGEDPDSLIRKHGPEAFSACMQQACTLVEHIHATCSAGFADSPCLEDKALYLVRMDPYLETATGYLRLQMLDKASTFTGLSKDQIGAGKSDRTEAEAMGNWHPLVTLAARWLVHDQDQARISQRLSAIAVGTNGLAELVNLASVIAQAEDPSGPMFEYASVHGPLTAPEFAQLRDHWGKWLKHSQVSEGLAELGRDPFDEGAKQKLRAMLR